MALVGGEAAENATHRAAHDRPVPAGHDGFATVHVEHASAPRRRRRGLDREAVHVVRRTLCDDRPMPCQGAAAGEPFMQVLVGEPLDILSDRTGEVGDVGT